MKFKWVQEWGKGSRVELVKSATGLITSLGIHGIVSGAVQTNVPRGNIAQNACVFVAKTVVSSMISEAARRHTDEQIDELVVVWNDATLEAKDNDGRSAS